MKVTKLFLPFLCALAPQALMAQTDVTDIVTENDQQDVPVVQETQQQDVPVPQEIQNVPVLQKIQDDPTIQDPQHQDVPPVTQESQQLKVEDGNDEVLTIDQVVREQQKFTETLQEKAHLEKVWHRRSYFNLIYGSSTQLTPEDRFLNRGAEENELPEYYEPEMAFGIKNGRSFFLHRKAIAKVLYFGLDYTWIDLTFNKYKAVDKNGNKLDKKTNPGFAYNSSSALTFQLEDEDGMLQDYRYTPFNLEKFEIDYGMAVGPSIHIAPFTYIRNARGLHHLRFNMYFHVGYNFGLLYMKDEKKFDRNTVREDESPAMDLGMGLTTAFGFGFNWKAIGFGFENHKADLKYGAILDKDTYSENKYNFTSSAKRIYLQFRF